MASKLSLASTAEKESEVRSQKSGVRSQESEVRSQKSGVLYAFRCRSLRLKAGNRNFHRQPGLRSSAKPVNLLNECQYGPESALTCGRGLQPAASVSMLVGSHPMRDCFEVSRRACQETGLKEGAQRRGEAWQNPSTSMLRPPESDSCCNCSAATPSGGTLKGSDRKAQGASPGDRRKAKDQPCKGGTGCAALTGLFSRMRMIPGLTPWAFLFRPFGHARQANDIGAKAAAERPSECNRGFQAPDC